MFWGSQTRNNHDGTWACGLWEGIQGGTSAGTGPITGRITGWDPLTQHLSQLLYHTPVIGTRHAVKPLTKWMKKTTPASLYFEHKPRFTAQEPLLASLTLRYLNPFIPRYGYSHSKSRPFLFEAWQQRVEDDVTNWHHPFYGPLCAHRNYHSPCKTSLIIQEKWC